MARFARASCSGKGRAQEKAENLGSCKALDHVYWKMSKARGFEVKDVKIGPAKLDFGSCKDTTSAKTLRYGSYHCQQRSRTFLLAVGWVVAAGVWRGITHAES